MALGPRLDLRQSHSLVMTPQLQQAIKLLALSNLEIETFIAEELEKNPLLEAERGPAGDDEGPAAPEADFDAAPADPDALPEADAAGGDGALDVDHDGEDFHQDSAVDRMGGADAKGMDGGLGLDSISISGSGEGPDFDAFAGDNLSLHDHLRHQAGEILSGADLLIAEQLIERIDETGYFLASLGETAQRLGVPLAEAERILALIQTFDPSGVGARNLAECLALQAKDANRYDPAMARLIANLDYLAKGNLAALKRICQVDDEDMADMIRELRAYDPKPGCRFSAASERVDAVVPDIFVTRGKNGWAVELNSAT